MRSDRYLLSSFFLCCWAFNAASWRSVMNHGPRFTAMDPVLSSIALAIGFVTLNGTKKFFPKTYVFVTLIGGVCFLGTCIFHILNRERYMSSDAFDDENWRYAAVINAVGAWVLFWCAMSEWKPEYVLAVQLAGGICLLAVLTMGGEDAALFATAPDAPFFFVDHQPTQQAALPYQYSSQYVTMSDGVDLAVDVYLPNEYKQGDALPTFLHLTRYHRGEKRSWLTKFVTFFGHLPNKEGVFPMRSLPYINMFVPDGYAFVMVDVRGTGASFGSRPLDLIDREVQDFQELAAWTRNQTFCNGRIGTGGISYDGMTGALMAAQGNIEALAMLFTPADLWEDIGFVGGVPTIGFIDWYGKLTNAFENNMRVNDVDNELPATFKLFHNWAILGVAPVRGEEDRLPQAILQHEANLNMLKLARDPTIRTKDSALLTTPDGREHSFLDLGINRAVMDGLVHHKVSVYNVAGYYDSGSVRSSARVHNYLFRKGADSKFTIGPCTHGWRACWTPTQGDSATKPAYPLYYDLKRFFDCKLKNKCRGPTGVTGIGEEPRLHYDVSASDKFESAPDEWPPLGLQELPMELGSFTMQTNKNILQNRNGVVSYRVDFESTSGIASRWNLVFHLMKNAVTYPDRKKQTVNALVFKTAFESDMVIVGSPKVTLSISLSDKDAVVFAYLEEENMDTGETYYITESTLRLSHRAKPRRGDIRIGSSEAVVRSYLIKDFKPWRPGVFQKVEFLLEPVAYQVRKNSQLRLVLAGADKDNFYLDNVEGLSKEWSIDTGSSWLVLPHQRN